MVAGVQREMVSMSDHAELLFDVYSHSDNAMLRATLAPVMADPDAFATHFYANLFARAPALRSLFPSDMNLQRMKLVQTLGVVAAGLDQPEVLIGTLEELGARHRGYGVKFAHYVEVGEALIAALAEVNGPAFTGSARSAWHRLYAWVAEQMRRG